MKELKKLHKWLIDEKGEYERLYMEAKQKKLACRKAGDDEGVRIYDDMESRRYAAMRAHYACVDKVNDMLRGKVKANLGLLLPNDYGVKS